MPALKNPFVFFCIGAAELVLGGAELKVRRDIPYAASEDPRQRIDVYAPEGARNAPVVFWIHGGGWQTGSRTNAQHKPAAFAQKGFVFASTGYRLLPDVEMREIFQDI